MTLIENVQAELADATADLLADVGTLNDAEARGESLLPDWTRGHVLTHLARNAEGGTRLLGWARTGTPSYEYEGLQARADAINQGAGRPARSLVEDVQATAEAFADAANAMPPEAWRNVVTWTTGHQTPAEMIIRSRLGEVLIHHVDLKLGFGPGSWPPAFVQEMLAGVVDNLNKKNPRPSAATLTATDSARSFEIGPSSPNTPQISGTGSDLLAWLLGRSDGPDLDTTGSRPLPSLPSAYST